MTLALVPWTSMHRWLMGKHAIAFLLAFAAQAAAPLAQAQAGGAPRMNLTGAWEGNFLGGSTFQLTQDGDRVHGTFVYGNGTGFARGDWRAGSLIIILTPTEMQVGGPCEPRKLVVVAAKGSVTRLAPYVLDLTNNNAYEGGLTRTSPSPGAVGDYPYEAELKNCGQLFTYELAFETGSDKLIGGDFPILQTLAGLMQKDGALKLQIAGHTDSIGDATANLALSERRAKAVVQILSARYHVDATRLSAKGYGSEQPLADNGTEQGRAINRRVELVKQ